MTRVTVRIEEIGKADKAAKDLPDEAKRIWVDAYNHDFATRASEAHAMKSAWRSVRAAGYGKDEGAKAA